MTWHELKIIARPLSRHCKQLLVALTITVIVYVFVVLQNDTDDLETTSSSSASLRGRLKAMGRYNLTKQNKTMITWKTLAELLPGDVRSMELPDEFNICRPSQIWKNVIHHDESHRFPSCNRVFYNRVPKCGSRTVVSVFRALSGQNDFSSYSFVRPGGRGYFRSTENLVDFAMNFSQLPEPFLYSQHLHFVNFTQLGIPPPVYINVIRDPVERVISHFYYTKYGSGYHGNKEPSHNVSLEQCVKPHKVCRLSSLNVMIPFFCGHPKSCRSIGPDAVQRAKRTLRQSYLVVGFTEDLPAFMDVLEILMPNFFSNATNVFNELEDLLINKTQTTKKPAVPLRIVATLKRLLAHEYDFYNFAKQRFYTQYDKLFTSADGVRESDWISKRRKRRVPSSFFTVR